MTKIGVICDFQKKPVLGANLVDQKKKNGGDTSEQLSKYFLHFSHSIFTLLLRYP